MLNFGVVTHQAMPSFPITANHIMFYSLCIILLWEESGANRWGNCVTLVLIFMEILSLYIYSHNGHEGVNPVDSSSYPFHVSFNHSDPGTHRKCLGVFNKLSCKAWIFWRNWRDINLVCLSGPNISAVVNDSVTVKSFGSASVGVNDGSRLVFYRTF